MPSWHVQLYDAVIVYSFIAQFVKIHTYFHKEIWLTKTLGSHTALNTGCTQSLRKLRSLRALLFCVCSFSLFSAAGRGSRKLYSVSTPFARGRVSGPCWLTNRDRVARRRGSFAPSPSKAILQEHSVETLWIIVSIGWCMRWDSLE
jgi:hypothetical protein